MGRALYNYKSLLLYLFKHSVCLCVCVFVQYANGGTLEELLANKSRDVSWPSRIRLACDVAKGVKYLHSRNLMHRDLTSKVCLSVCLPVCL